MVNTLQFTRTTKLAWRFPDDNEAILKRNAAEQARR
jgi:hypothetical protein